MNKGLGKLLVLLTVSAWLFCGFLELEAFARAGGGGSFGSRGSRSAPPGRSYTPPAQTQPRSNPNQSAPRPDSGFMARQSSGGFMRSLAGGLMGGFLGALLFRSLGFGGTGLGFGGGIGIFEILLVGAIAYGIYRYVKSRRQQSAALESDYNYRNRDEDYDRTASYSSPPSHASESSNESETERGLRYLRGMDPSFNEENFKETCSDIFFKVQAAWLNRDLSSVNGSLTPEVYAVLKEGVDDLKRQGRINHLDNISLRTIDIVEVWQEAGADFITTRFFANLLDYTVDEVAGQVVSGSKVDPVKFEEYWTFTRPVGRNPWKLSAIQQA